jgi:hypothetical protein
MISTTLMTKKDETLTVVVALSQREGLLTSVVSSFFAAD